MDKSVTIENLKDMLVQHIGTQVPGFQYIVVNANGILFKYAGGWADIKNRKAMTLETTLMAYSLTKTFTAVAILQLVEQEKIGLDDKIDSYFPDIPYSGCNITIRHLLNHTSGIPNPPPLRWAHLADENASFDENKALVQICNKYPKLSFTPGKKYGYSNIGYWLLGKIIEQIAEQSYSDYVRAGIFTPLGIPKHELDFIIPVLTRHARGYLNRYSWINLMKVFFTDRKYWGKYEGKWLNIKNHYVNGPAFGGLVGNAFGLAHFLTDQLRAESVLFNRKTKGLLESRQADNSGRLISMTLGWHVGVLNGSDYLVNIGSGAGYKSGMHLYPDKGIASMVMTNSTEFNTNEFQKRIDRFFWEVPQLREQSG